MKIINFIANWLERNDRYGQIGIGLCVIALILVIYIAISIDSYQKDVNAFCKSVDNLTKSIERNFPVNETHEKPSKKNAYVFKLPAMNAANVQTNISKKAGFKTIVDKSIDLGSNGVWDGLIQLRISHDNDSTYCVELINKNHRKYIIPLGGEYGWQEEIWTVKTSTLMSEYSKIMMQQGDSTIQNKIEFVEKLEAAGIPVPSFIEPKDIKGNVMLAESNFRLGSGGEDTLFKQLICTKKYCPTPINMIQPRFYTIELFDENLEPGKEHLKIQLDLDALKVSM